MRIRYALAFFALVIGVASGQTPPPPATAQPSPAPKVPMSSFEAIQAPPPMTAPSDAPALRLQLDEHLTPPAPLRSKGKADDETPQPPAARRGDEPQTPQN